MLDKKKFLLIIIPFAVFLVGFGFYMYTYKKDGSGATNTGNGLYEQNQVTPSSTQEPEQQAIVIPLSIKTLLSSFATEEFGSAKTCYKNSELRLSEIHIVRNEKKMYGPQDDTPVARISLKSAFFNGSKTERCGYTQEIVRLIDDKDTIHTSEGGPANSVAPFSTDEVVLMFTVPNDTRNIQLMVGSPVHPDAIYEIDFTTRMVRQKQVPQGRYLRLIAPLESQSLCIGNNLKIGWESNDIHGISIFIHELGYASWFIGKFPAELNETGERGKGEFIWKIGYTKEGKKIDTLKEDATYDIQISSTDADKPVIQDNSKATFTIMNCQG